MLKPPKISNNFCWVHIQYLHLTWNCCRLALQATHSLCPLMTLMAWMDGPRRSHILKLQSSDEVSSRRWVGWVQQCVSFRSWPAVAPNSLPCYFFLLSSRLPADPKEPRHYCKNQPSINLTIASHSTQMTLFSFLSQSEESVPSLLKPVQSFWLEFYFY